MNEEDPGKWWRKREAFHRKIKRESHYHELTPRPRCCLTCCHGRITEDFAECDRIDDDNFGYPDIDLFGICDHWEAKRGIYA